MEPAESLRAALIGYFACCFASAQLHSCCCT